MPNKEPFLSAHQHKSLGVLDNGGSTEEKTTELVQVIAQRRLLEEEFRDVLRNSSPLSSFSVFISPLPIRLGQPNLLVFDGINTI
jgi:hypothetical protein